MNMKNVLLPLSLFFGAAVFTACGNDTNTETETDTTTTTTSTTIDTSTTAVTPTGTTYSSTPLTGDDSTFAREAASAGMMEVEAGRLAQQNATNPRVKSFAEMMVRDHSAANDELKRIASAKNFMVSDSLTKKQRDHMESMQKMSGKAFDKHYMDMMVKDHNTAVQKFEKAAANCKDADLKAFAEKTLPVLRTHQDSVKAINQSKM
jgi:putative membrane protein